MSARGLEEYAKEEWWDAAAHAVDPHEIAIPRIKTLLSQQSIRYDNYKKYNAAFEFGASGSYDGKGASDKLATFNHAASAIETVASKLLKSRTDPTPLTYGGTAVEQDNAKQLQKATLGEFKKSNVEGLTEDVVYDGLICGNGFAWVPPFRGKIDIRFAPADDVVVDEAECRYRMKSVRTIFIREVMDRDVAMKCYGRKGEHFYGSIRDRKDAIADAPVSEAQKDEQGQKNHNQIDVWHCFHLRSDEDADDGAYCVCVESGTLMSVDWERDRVPVADFTPYPRRRRLHGKSLMADFLPPQQEHDKVSTRIQASYHRMGGAMLAIAREANIEERELTNGQGTRIYYDALGGPNPITPINPNFVNAETFNYRQQIIAEMQSSKGIPSMAMTGQLPEGMNGASGKAIQLAEEQVAERLTVQHRALDRFMIDLAWLVVDEAEAVVDGDKGYAVNYRTRRNLERVKWRDALLARDSYEFDIAPAGDLARAPSARFDQLTKELELGAITNDTFKRLWNHGADVEAENDLDQSDTQIIDMVLATIAKENRQILPEAFDDLKLAAMRARKFYNLARIRNEKPEILRKIADYAKRAVDLKKKADAEMAAMQAQMNTPPAQAQPTPQNAA